MVDSKNWKNLEIQIIGADPNQPHDPFEQAMREFLRGLSHDDLKVALSEIVGFIDSSYCKSPTDISWEMATQSRIGGSMPASMEEFCDNDMTASARAEQQETEADKSRRAFRVWAGETARRLAEGLLELVELRSFLGKEVGVEHYCDTITHHADDQPSTHNVHVYSDRGVLEKIDDQAITIAGQTIFFRDEDDPMKSGRGVPVGCGYGSAETAITLILADGNAVYNRYNLLPEGARHLLNLPS